jgi:hypothetical protein
MNEDQFQALNSGMENIRNSLDSFQESSRKNLKDVNSTIINLSSDLGEVKGEVHAMERTLSRQDKAIDKLFSSKAKHDETLKTLGMKTTKDSWTRIPILYLKSPLIKKVLTVLGIALFIAIGIAAILVLASIAGQEIVIKTPTA